MKQFMLCRNKVRDYAVWRKIFDSHKAAHQAAGLILRRMWRSVDDPNTVFFIFKMRDRKKAEAFVTAPDSPKIGEAAGVLDDEIHYVEETAGY